MGRACRPGRLAAAGLVTFALALLLSGCGGPATLRDRRESDPTAVTVAAAELAHELLPVWPGLLPSGSPGPGEPSTPRDPQDGSRALLPRQGPAYPPVRLLILSDIHYLSPRLWEPGEAFARWLSTNDGKVLARSAELLALIEERVVAEHHRAALDAVVITGDLTANGEEASHADIAAMASRLRSRGIPVLVTPGNHDVANPWAASFAGSAARREPSPDRNALLRIYRDAGPGDAASIAPDDLSYRYDLRERLSLVVLDTAMYTRNAELGFPQPTGEIGSRQRRWLEVELAAAREQGRAVLVFMHHNLLSHGRPAGYGTLQYVVDDAPRLQRLLWDHGVTVVFTGHIHARNSTGQRGSGGSWVYDLAAGAVSLFPHEYRLVTIDAGQQLRIEPRHLIVPLSSRAPGGAPAVDELSEEDRAAFARWSLATYLSDIKTDRSDVLAEELLATSPENSIEAVLCEPDAEPCTGNEQLAAMALYVGVWSLLHRDGLDPAGVPEDLVNQGSYLRGGRALWQRHAPDRYARLLRAWGTDPAPADGVITIDLARGLWW